MISIGKTLVIYVWLHVRRDDHSPSTLTVQCEFFQSTIHHISVDQDLRSCESVYMKKEIPSLLERQRMTIRTGRSWSCLRQDWMQLTSILQEVMICRFANASEMTRVLQERRDKLGAEVPRTAGNSKMDISSVWELWQKAREFQHI
jgi:hypothetical protein